MQLNPIYAHEVKNVLLYANSSRIRKPRLSASSSCLIRTSSLITVNLWPLARVSDRGLIPLSRLIRVDLGTAYNAAALDLDRIFFIFIRCHSHLYSTFLRKRHFVK